MLQRHNANRWEHQVGGLTTNYYLEHLAQICANYYASIDQIDHSCPEARGYGENLSWSWDSRGSPDDPSAVATAYDSWFSEGDDYNYYTGKSYGGVVGHFTQILWRESQELGCATSQNTWQQSTVVVCLYNPPGNYIGQETQNVF
ncbi:unnamed protein product [Allacma fusca]|uniref:SCP domain-containing protein n=1 Tax=Allacma fusca TaxID=39272 RepID=A0A8J2JEJ9_9HEXA|nr:unnamed protein product [Allacma fusca]